MIAQGELSVSTKKGPGPSYCEATGHHDASLLFQNISKVQSWIQIWNCEGHLSTSNSLRCFELRDMVRDPAGSSHKKMSIQWL